MIAGAIVAIGGRELGSPGTSPIDKEIIALSGKSCPRALFLPTASNDAERYIRLFTNIYGKRLGCTTAILRLVTEKPTADEIAERIAEADVIYAGGGNTVKMLRLWRRLGVDALMHAAHARGAVLCGVSAGGMCWFQYGVSGSRLFGRKGFVRARGLGLVQATFCPHFDGEIAGGNVGRDKTLSGMIEKHGGIGLGVDNSCAVAFRDGAWRVIQGKPGVNAYLVARNGERVVRAPLAVRGSFEPLSKLALTEASH